MKLAISVPSGYHIRELLLPLKSFLEFNKAIDRITCISPAAPHRDTVFSTYGDKFDFVANPQDDSSHEELLKNVSPDVVITTTSGLDPNDVAILKAAQKNKLRTVTFIASWDNVWKMERLLQQGKPQVIADHLIVWNQMMKDHLLRIFPKLPAERIAIIGAPRFDFFSQNDLIPDKKELRAYLGIPNDDSRLIHFATTELYPMDYVVKTIHEAIQKGSISHTAHFYVSVHPGGNLAKYAGMKEYGAHIRFSFGRQDKAPHPDFRYNPSLKDIYMLVALFKHSDLLINHSSTVALESFAADVPVINVKYGKPWDAWRWYRSMVYRDFQQHYNDLISDGATKVVTSKQDLVAATNTYLAHPEYERETRRATLKKIITTVDGSASRQVFEYIKNVAV